MNKLPTRIGQQFNEGSVVGFNTRSGCVIVCANHSLLLRSEIHPVTTLSHSESLESFPTGYSWPLITDFDRWETISCSIDYFCLLEHLTKVFSGRSWARLAVQLPNGTFSFDSYRIILVSLEHKTSVVVDYTDVIHGRLVPVFKLNGANCNSY